MKIGDRVKLIEKSSYSDHSINPIWGGNYGYILGTVTKDNLSTAFGGNRFKYRVRWDNESENTYRETDLQLEQTEWD